MSGRYADAYQLTEKAVRINSGVSRYENSDAPMSESTLIGTPSDYTDDLYRVYLEIGCHTDFGRRVIESFPNARAKDVPRLGSSPIALVKRDHGYEMDVPIQIIPEIVRELADKNIAVYQVIRVAKV